MHFHITELQCGHMLAVNFNPATGQGAPGLIAWSDIDNSSEWIATAHNSAGNIVFPEVREVRQVVDVGSTILLVGVGGVVAMKLSHDRLVFHFERFLSAGVVRADAPDPVAQAMDEARPVVIDGMAETIERLEHELAESITDRANLKSQLADRKLDLHVFTAFARELLATPKAEHMADSIPVISAGVRHLTWGHFRALLAGDQA